MKKSTLFVAFVLLTGLFTVSCKKCQTCTTDTTQNVLGFNQTVTTSEEYCGDEYDDAPAEGSYSNNVSGIQQSVTITCTDN